MKKNVFILALLILLTAKTSFAAKGVDQSIDLGPEITQVQNLEQGVKKTEGLQEWWQALIYDIVFNFFIPVFIPVLSLLILLLLRKIGLKIELETLEKLGTTAAKYAEQRGRVWLRETGEKSADAQKERWAWEHIQSVDVKFGGSVRLREILRGVILSKLPEISKKNGVK